MEARSWPYFDPDYETIGMRISPPRVVVDNDAYDDATLVKVDSGNRHGILLEVVQLLTDLDLTVTKAYISSDGRWFMVGKSGKPAILFSGYWVEQNIGIAPK
jgi:UTP:GlnB (protein PII) uridylyltransferase